MEDQITVTLDRTQLQALIDVMDILKSALDGAAAQSDATAAGIPEEEAMAQAAPQGIDYNAMVSDIEATRGAR